MYVLLHYQSLEHSLKKSSDYTPGSAQRVLGYGEAIADKKLLDNAAADLAAISGQKPLITKARKSVAGFKIRQGYPIGCKVTLRSPRRVTCRI